MRKAAVWIVGIVALIVLFGAIFGGKAYLNRRSAEEAAARTFPPATVSTAVAEAQRWDQQQRVVATLSAVQGTQITAQIAGNVTKIGFESGRHVKRGDLLVQLDDSSQLAQLHADEATLTQARTALARAQALYAEHATSQASLQAAQAAMGTASAAIERDRATLAKLRITAPFSGVVGIREVSLGQYVSPGTAVVDLQSWQPLFVNFSLPQSSLPELKVGDAVQFEVDAFPGKAFAARINAIGAQVAAATRNITVQATLANADGRLRPGLYGHAALNLGAPLQGVAVPNTALAYSTFGDTVYVVRDKGGKQTAHAQIVEVGPTRGDQVLVTKGLQGGDTVVIAGQNKLHDGAPVQVNNKVSP